MHRKRIKTLAATFWWETHEGETEVQVTYLLILTDNSRLAELIYHIQVDSWDIGANTGTVIHVRLAVFSPVRLCNSSHIFPKRADHPLENKQ